MFEWSIALSSQLVIFVSIKMMGTKLLPDREIDNAVNHHCRVIWYLFSSFKIIILCSVYFIWFVKFEFSAKI